MSGAAINLFHGTDHDTLPLHTGLCLADDEDAAGTYGKTIHEVELDLDGLTVEEVDIDLAAVKRDGEDYPADTESDRATYLARGVDVIVFDDIADRLGGGTEHRTYRILSDRALARLA